VTVDQSSELVRLREMVRDLLALSTIQQAWVGREALAIAGGLADVLLDSLNLDFVFVRLRDPIEGDAIEVARGHSSQPLPDWLRTRIGEIGHLSRTEILSEGDGDGAEPHCAVAVPLGVNAESGLVVAACRRTDFPSEIDRLLLPVAANQAATAVQSAYLREQLNAKVVELGHAHDDLEVRVVERTTALNAANAQLSALRRVATLVALEASRSEVFIAIAQEIALLLEFREIRLVRYEEDSAVVVDVWGSAEDVFPVGAAVRLADDSVAARVFQTGQPVRIDNYAGLKGPVADAARSTGVHSVVAWPISVGGRLWGALTAGVIEEEALPPPEIESHLGQFTELMATAIANAEARAEVKRLAEDQSALRRVATLVAETAPPAEIFAAVSNEVATLFRTEMVVVGKFDGDPVGLLVTGVGDRTDEPVVGSRWKLDDALASTAVYRTGLPARFDRDSTIADPDVAGVVERFRPTATVAVPIHVEGRLWGAMIVSTRDALLPSDSEERLQRFTDLVATALANAEARAEVHRLADEQAALRRVAVLVAQQPSPNEVFTAVTQEVGLLLGAELAVLHVFPGDGTATIIAGSSGDGGPIPPTGTRFPLDGDSLGGRIFETGAPARVDSYAEAEGEILDLAQRYRVRSAVGAPILVEGKLWGALMAFTRGVEPWAEDAETRIAAFTELVATAIANAESREALAELAEEQAALRRVATLVAEGVPSAELLSGVTIEVARVFSGIDPSLIASVIRFDPGPESVLVGTSRAYEQEPLGARWAPKDLYVSTRVLRTERSARVDEVDLDAIGGPDADVLRLRGFLYQVGCPVLVEGQLWGAMCLNSKQELPPDTDRRLESFTELVATAIANAESRKARAGLTEEQAALRRVATLVARDAPSTEVFEAVATEVGKLLDTDITVVGRYDGDGAATAIGSWSASPGAVPVGTRSAIGGRNVLTTVAETGEPARMDGYDDATGEAGEIARRYGWSSSIAAPIVVEDRLWGVMLVATQRLEPFPSGAEARLAAFTDLVATAVANTEARHALERVAAEQAALRRVATLVAHGASSQDLFDAVAEEVGRLLPAANISMGRYESDDSVTSMASWSADGPTFTPGVRWPIKGTNVAWLVLQTGRQARIDDFSVATDPIGVAVREAGYKAAIGSPIVVEGHLWGVISAASTEGPMPPDGEARLSSFTELVATAIMNAEGSAELAASRRRIVAASDEARRRMERDLHDGVQQQLVSLALELGMMKADPPTGDALKAQLASVTEDVGSVLDALVETARGIHPAILSQGGLAAALGALARRSAVPVKLRVQIEGALPDDVEVAAYYVAAEALTNAAKHARASGVHLDAATENGAVRLAIRDNGVGGAHLGGGSGLIGLQDRVEALGGTIKIDSAVGSGTGIVVTLPIATEPDQDLENVLGPPQALGSPASPA
jgi:GAF domain-containing protein